MVIAATQSVVVHREAVIGSEEVKRIVSLAELFQPFDTPIRIANRVVCQSRATIQVKADQLWQRRHLCGSCLGEPRVLGPESFEPPQREKNGNSH